MEVIPTIGKLIIGCITPEVRIAYDLVVHVLVGVLVGLRIGSAIDVGPVCIAAPAPGVCIALVVAAHVDAEQ
jgi:hypothetical protein